MPEKRKRGGEEPGAGEKRETMEVERKDEEFPTLG